MTEGVLIKESFKLSDGATIFPTKKLSLLKDNHIFSHFIGFIAKQALPFSFG